MKLDIKPMVIGIIDEYGTNDPFQIAEAIGIHIFFHELPDSLSAYRLDNMIVINKKLPDEKQKWILSHELGHYFIHGPEATLGNFIKNPLLVKAKYEKQADIFASELLLADINAYMIEGLTNEQIAQLFNVPTTYVNFKLRKKEVMT